MTNLRRKAATVLQDWQQYKSLHFSNKTNFANAVDIAIDRDAVSQAAALVSNAAMGSTVTTSELKALLASFEKRLGIFKDRVTFELLKNGN